MFRLLKKIATSVIDLAIDKHLKQSENAIKFAQTFFEE